MSDFYSRYFYVDYENVSKSGLKGLDNLGKTDRVWVFCTENAKGLTVDIFEAAKASKASIDFIKVTNGSKNALDFQLATQLGFDIAENKYTSPKNSPKPKYFVITHDNGFSILANYWKKHGISVSFYSDLTLSKTMDKFNAEFAAKSAKKNAAPAKPVPPPKPKAQPAPSTAEARKKAFCALKKEEKKAIMKKLNQVLNDDKKATYVFQHLGTGTRKILQKNLTKKYGSKSESILKNVMPIIDKYI